VEDVAARHPQVGLDVLRDLRLNARPARRVAGDDRLDGVDEMLVQ